MVDFSIAPVRLGGHRLEEASAADGRLQAVTTGLANYERNPGVGMWTEDQIGVMGLDQLHEIGDDLSLWPFQQTLASIKYLDAGDLPGHGWIYGHLQLETCQRNREVRGEPGFISVSARKEVLLGQVTLILADVHIIELGLVTGWISIFSATLRLAWILWPWKVPKMVLKLYSSALKRLSRASIISRWAGGSLRCI